jgi:precorrin-6Y C5,15-methyltransferase (decarboxylating)
VSAAGATGDGNSPITIVGVPPGGFGAGAPRDADKALRDAHVVAVPARLRRLVAHLLRIGVEELPLTGDVPALLDQLEVVLQAGHRVVVIAGGDPGFFGIGRALAERFGPEAVRTLPAASAVATAFGRIGLPWDDALVVSAHGRPIAEAVAALLAPGVTKAAVLTSPDTPPGSVGRAVAEGGGRFERAAVASELGSEHERVESGDLAWLSRSDAPGMSVVLLWNGSGVSAAAVVSTGAAGVASTNGAALSFGLPESAYEHRGGMVTKAEVRTFCLARLDLPRSGVLWDVGAGSGSIAIEAASISPGLRVLAVERSTEDCERIGANAARSGVRVEVVVGEAPDCLYRLPPPDRIMVGGGGLDVLRAGLGHLRPGGRIVATFAAMERAVAAADLLGNLTQIAASRGRRLPDGSWRLAANDPVFVCWGDKEQA